MPGIRGPSNMLKTTNHICFKHVQTIFDGNGLQTRIAGELQSSLQRDVHLPKCQISQVLINSNWLVGGLNPSEKY